MKSQERPFQVQENPHKHHTPRRRQPIHPEDDYKDGKVANVCGNALIEEDTASSRNIVAHFCPDFQFAPPKERSQQGTLDADSTNRFLSIMRACSQVDGELVN